MSATGFIRYTGSYGLTGLLNQTGRIIGDFNPLSLSPYQWTMMETGLLNADGDAASSGDSISVVQNLGSGASNYGQTTGADQPVLHKTKGLYLPGAAGNSVSVPNEGALIPAGELTLIVKLQPKTWTPASTLYVAGIMGGSSDRSYRLEILGSGQARLSFSVNGSATSSLTSDVLSFSDGDHGWIRYTRNPVDGAYTISESSDGVTWTVQASGTSTTGALFSAAADFEIGSTFGGGITALEGLIYQVKVLNNGTTVLDIDFTTQDHNTLSFAATTGGTVTISQAGNDPATVIEYPFLRFDGVNSWLEGTYNSALSGGYMFCLFSVIGDGGLIFGRVFSSAPTGGVDTQANGAIWLGQFDLTGNSRSFFGDAGGTVMQRTDGFAGTGLHEISLKTGAHKSLLNGAAELTNTAATTFNFQDFSIGARSDNGSSTAAIDVFVHGMFDKDLSDAEAVKVRSYIGNQRTNISSGYV
jgi:hypothetical protein